MTTIVYKDGIIACDGRVCCGDTIITDNREKRYSRNGVDFFICGNDEAAGQLLDSWPDAEVSNDGWNALVLEDGALWFCGLVNGRVWKSRQPADEPMALGSGSDHAFTAIDMGAGAKEAVEMAAKRDSHTGGTIREYRVD